MLTAFLYCFSVLVVLVTSPVASSLCLVSGFLRGVVILRATLISIGTCYVIICGFGNDLPRISIHMCCSGLSRNEEDLMLKEDKNHCLDLQI